MTGKLVKIPRPALTWRGRQEGVRVYPIFYLSDLYPISVNRKDREGIIYLEEGWMKENRHASAC